MDDSAKLALDSSQPTTTLRLEQPDDEAFLLELYASTRQEELELTQWDAVTRAAFVQMQFKAMRQGYATMFPLGQFSIVLFQGRAIGRMVIDRSEQDIRLVDMAIIPEERCRGIGTFLVQALQAEARQSQKQISLHVLQGNRAMHFYERLGFHCTGGDGLYNEMTWPAIA